MSEKQQRIYVVAFILHNSQLLIVKRPENKKMFPSHYELPGGRVEFGEEPSEALKREIKEELDVNIDILHPFHSFQFFPKEGEVHCVEIAFFAKLLDSPDKIKLLDHDELQWINEKDLNLYEISELEKESMLKGFQFKNNQNLYKENSKFS